MQASHQVRGGGSIEHLDVRVPPNLHLLPIDGRAKAHQFAVQHNRAIDLAIAVLAE